MSREIINNIIDNHMPGTVTQKPNEYFLANFRTEEDGSRMHQKITFYEMENNDSYDNGTTIEEMLRVSVERLQHLNNRYPCRENALAITKIQEALMWLNARTADREKRGVEGKYEV